MRPHDARLLLLLTICGTAAAQTANPQLTISPRSDWLSPQARTVVFTAQLESPLKPFSVTLCLLDSSDKVLSTQGELRDDGIEPDAKAGDNIYSRQLQLPLDKRGIFHFRVRAEYPHPVGIRQSLSKAFAVKMETPQNAERDLWVQSFDDETWVHFITELPGIRKIKLLRASSLGGPWMLIGEFDYPNGPGVEKGEVVDSDPAIASNDFYYKMVLYDANAVLKYAYSPVFVPAYGRPDQLLVLPSPPKQ